MKLTRLSQDEFISRAKAVHPYYDYSLSVYEQSHKNIKVICPTCGIFEISPANLLRGVRCAKCADTRLTTKEFVDRVKLISPEYGYELVEYVNNKLKVKVICHRCGIFESKPNNLLDGHGCPCCADKGYNPGKPAVLYIHEITGLNHDFTGFGITRNNKSRTRSHTKNLNREGYSIVDSFTTEKLDGKFIQQLEKVLKDTFPLDINTSHIEGFKRESTTASYNEVVSFVKNYIENNKEIAYGNN